MHLLLDGATSNGAGDGIGAGLQIYDSKNVWAWGTFDGCSIAIEVSPDGVEWFSAKNSSGTALAYTAKGCDVLDVRAGFFRALVSSAGASTSVFVSIT